MTMFAHYEQQISPSRAQFFSSSEIGVLSSRKTDPVILERTLIAFSAQSTHVIRPVESWVQHDQWLLEDTHALVRHWNQRHPTPLHADDLLQESLLPGAKRFIQVHRNVLASDTPFAELAIEFEIEQIPVKFGRQIIENLIAVLGPEIIEGLRFLREHVLLDIEHTKSSQRQLEQLLEQHPYSLDALVAAGSEALEAFAEFMSNCAQVGRELSQPAPVSLA